MKKTLVAIAALALAGGAFAQSSVNLTGKFRFAYDAKNDGSGAATAKSNGFGVTDGNVIFAAVEDLGGGMKAGVSMDVRVRGRGAAGVVDGRDASVYLTGGFGTIVGGAVESGNGIIGLGGAGAPVIGLDDGIALAGATNIDWFAYSTPNMGGFTGTIGLADSIGLPGAGGMQSSAATQDAVVLRGAYSNGPINFMADYTSYGANSAAAPRADNRLRLSGNYNLGVATVGLGYQQSKNSASVKDKQWILGVAAPFGPVTVGANITNRKVDTGLKVTAYDMGVKYDLSKRTYVLAAYQSEDSNALVNNKTQFRLQLSHAF
jgi:predicted porin